jgi:hypothetical protein
MTPRLPKLIATSVVRGSRQGVSQSGVYTVDFANLVVGLLFDWNKSDIEFKSQSGDRGLRGIS